MLSTRVVAVVTAVLGAVAFGLPASSPAQADTVLPSTRSYSAPIDNPASWERESGCSQSEKKGPKKLRKLLLATYGPIYANILRQCSKADSGHEEGRALDWMVSVRDPAQKAIAESYLTWLQAPDEFGNPAAMARRLGISYVIWNNQLWRPGSGLWSDYSDCAKKKKRGKKFDTYCHRDHVHTSFSWDGALGRTSFYTGYVACPAPVVTSLPPVLVPAAPVIAPLAPARLLGTRKGIGLAAGPCRVHPDVRLDLPVLGAGGVPATGVAAVTLRVYVIKPDAPAELRVWTAGTSLPLVPVSTALQGVQTVTDVTVPVGPSGLVSLQMAGGMGHLAVDVTGYSVGAAF